MAEPQSPSLESCSLSLWRALRTKEVWMCLPQGGSKPRDPPWDPELHDLSDEIDINHCLMCSTVQSIWG